MDIETKNVKVRFPPSPTGFMHIGTLRTMLYNYLFARGHEGKVILRIEDTDQSRKVEGAVESIEQMISWAGIHYDEGPVFQSDRVREGIYTEHIERLVMEGHAYRCFCTPEKLDEMRSRQQAMKQPPMYDRTCVDLEAQDVQTRMAAGEKSVVRMKVPRGEEIVVEDIVRGRVTFQTNTIDDQVLLKSDGFPTYHSANVIDDHMMEITHVLRGEEWTTSTPKHILLYRMFGWDVPVFGHLPLLLAADGKKKLSKRQGDVSVEEFINKGYLQGAIINFVALLGWNPGGGSTEEIFSLEELVKVFRIEKVHKAGAAVDIKRLNWMNAKYIKALSLDELHDIGRDFFDKSIADLYPEWSPEDRESVVRRIMAVEQDRLETLCDFGKENSYFFGSIALDPELLTWKENTPEQTVEALQKAREVLTAVTDEDWTRENLQNVLMEAAGEDRGSFLWPLRAALTGQKRSPSPMDCAWALGKEESLVRINNAINA